MLLFNNTNHCHSIIIWFENFQMHIDRKHAKIEQILEVMLNIILIN